MRKDKETKADILEASLLTESPILMKLPHVLRYLQFRAIWNTSGVFPELPFQVFFCLTVNVFYLAVTKFLFYKMKNRTHLWPLSGLWKLYLYSWWTCSHRVKKIKKSLYLVRVDHELWWEYWNTFPFYYLCKSALYLDINKLLLLWLWL